MGGVVQVANLVRDHRSSLYSSRVCTRGGILGLYRKCPLGTEGIAMDKVYGGKKKHLVIIMSNHMIIVQKKMNVRFHLYG